MRLVHESARAYAKQGSASHQRPTVQQPSGFPQTGSSCHQLYPHSHRNTLKSIERAKRLPPHHPCSRALAEHVKPRTQHRSWARQGKQLSTDHIPPEAELRQEINLTRKHPWVHQGTVTIFSSLEGVSNKSDDPATIRSAAEAAIARWNSDLTIFTDGSAVSGFRQGGAAAVVMINDDPPRFETLWTKGAAFTSSFEKECSAMELAN